MRIAITTTDRSFAEKYGDGLAADSSTVITVADEITERVTFAGHDMIRFDLKSIGALPRDWGNRWTMYPATRIR